MKHFFKKNKHHLGLWALSGLILLWSTIWLNSLENKTKPDSLLPSVTLNAISSSFLSPENNQPIVVSLDTNKTLPVSSTVEKSAEFLTTSSAKQENQEYNVTFEFISSGNEKKFHVAIMEDETVYQAMLQLKKEQGLIFEVQDYSGLGVFVESINDVANNPKENQFWIYYINNKAATTGISLTKLHHNDLITWRYENGKF